MEGLDEAQPRSVGARGASQVCGALDRNAAVSCAGATRMAGARAIRARKRARRTESRT